MTTKFWLRTAAVLAALTASSAQANNIVYSINQTSTTPEVGGELSPLSDTVIGTITTDGTIGVIQSSNIVSWNLQLNDNLRPYYDVQLTPANSGIVADNGNGLSATATALSFNFSDAGAGFAIQGTTHGFYSGYQYFCFQATSGGCASGETIVPYYYSVDGVAATGFSGTVPLSGVPEPATWATMLLGFAGIGLAAYRRARQTAGNIA
jgi:hypothetical protein